MTVPGGKLPAPDERTRSLLADLVAPVPVERAFPEVEFAVAPVEPVVRVVGIPDTVQLPGDVLEALEHLARVCRTAYGMGVEVEAAGEREAAQLAVETLRRYLG